MYVRWYVHSCKYMLFLYNMVVFFYKVVLIVIEDNSRLQHSMTDHPKGHAHHTSHLLIIVCWEKYPHHASLEAKAK